MAAPAPVRPLDDILAEVIHREETVEILFVAERRVRCQGGDGALGHPTVYYTIGDKGYAECMYCDRVYVYDPARAGEILEGGFTDGLVVRDAKANALPSGSSTGA